MQKSKKRRKTHPAHYTDVVLVVSNILLNRSFINLLLLCLSGTMAIFQFAKNVYAIIMII